MEIFYLSLHCGNKNGKAFLFALVVTVDYATTTVFTVTYFLLHAEAQENHSENHCGIGILAKLLN